MKKIFLSLIVFLAAAGCFARSFQDLMKFPFGTSLAEVFLSINDPDSYEILTIKNDLIYVQDKSFSSGFRGIGFKFDNNSNLILQTIIYILPEEDEIMSKVLQSTMFDSEFNLLNSQFNLKLDDTKYNDTSITLEFINNDIPEEHVQIFQDNEDYRTFGTAYFLE